MPHLVSHPRGAFWVWPDSVGQALAAGTFWDAHLRPALDRGDPTGWALDLGASTGWFTIYLAERYAGVVAVEAHPTTFSLLLQTLALHPAVLPRVRPVCCAAYDHATELEMCTAAEIGWPLPSQVDLDGAVCASGVAFHPVWGTGGLRVPALPMDRLLPSDQRVSVIKVDVQGCDLRALQGLTETIRRWRPLVVFEYEAISAEWQGTPFAAYETWFTAQGYTVTQITPDFSDFLAEPI